MNPNRLHFAHLPSNRFLSTSSLLMFLKSHIQRIIGILNDPPLEKFRNQLQPNALKNSLRILINHNVKFKKLSYLCKIKATAGQPLTKPKRKTPTQHSHNSASPKSLLISVISSINKKVPLYIH